MPNLHLQTKGTVSLIVCLTAWAVLPSCSPSDPQNANIQMPSSYPPPAQGQSAPISTLGELFLQTPDEYMAPPAVPYASVNAEARKKLIDAIPQDGLSMDLMDVKNGYLSFHCTQGGSTWRTEFTYFNTSDQRKLIGINHVWEGKVALTRSLHFLEKAGDIWVNRPEGVLPIMDATRFWKGGGNAPAIRSGAPDGRGNMAEAQVLVVLPHKGKTIRVLPPQQEGKPINGFQGEAIMDWRDGVFSELEQDVVDDCRTLPHEAFVIEESPGSGFNALPDGKDSRPNRMRLVRENHSHEGWLRLGSHPIVEVHEGSIDIARFSNMKGLDSPILAVSSTCGIGSCPPTIRFWQKADGQWGDVTKQVWPGLDLDKALEVFRQELPAEPKAKSKLLQGDLIPIFQPTQGSITVCVTTDAYETDEPTPLYRLKWTGVKFEKE